MVTGRGRRARKGVEKFARREEERASRIIEREKESGGAAHACSINGEHGGPWEE